MNVVNRCRFSIIFANLPRDSFVFSAMNCELEVVAATITGGVAFSEEEVEVLEEEEGVGVYTGGGAVGFVTIGAGLGSYKKKIHCAYSQ